jgi:ADP-dependent NAD(P)H-hydrate dehydratase
MSPSDPIELTPDVLDGLEIPSPSSDASKNDRGHVLVVGGSAETWGGVLLAGLAAFRVGAGRVQLATVASARTALLALVPEARVVGLPETAGGAIDPASSAEALAELASLADVVLIGSGALDVDATGPLVDVVTGCARFVIVDAMAIPGAGRHPEWIRRLDGRALAIPNDTELEELGGDARAAAELLGCVVSVRGSETLVVAPDGAAYVSRGGGVGQAMSGSGDVAAGVVAGLVARGASPVAAAAWGAVLHARAGERLAERIAPLGYLARELLDELPRSWAHPAAG